MEPFIHLHVHTQYSLLDGQASIDALIDKAQKDGMPAIAVTDHGVMFGIKEFFNKVSQKNGKPLGAIKDYEKELKELKSKTELTAEEQARLEEIPAKIEEEIKTMPNYFADYDTTVHFISEEEMKRDHSGLPHGGCVIRTGVTGMDNEHKHVIEYNLKLDSNPEFTGSVIAAYARAAYRMSKEGMSGCKTVFDIAPAYLSSRSAEDLRAHLL